ncbi:MAG TPA: HAMP domain-containing protein [Polyangiaceae bacterium]|nr:HAMP domain-containing protein [Polyangiaceae bacterium]
MGQAGAAPAAGRPQHKRHLKNYLLDAHFQLKYTSYLVLIAVVLSAALGIVLWRTSRAVIAQSHEAVHQGEQVVDLGKEVVGESQKVSAVVQMNIVKDPVYSDNPALLDAFKMDAAKQDERLKKQQKQLEDQATSLKAQSASLAERQRTMFTSLLVVLSLLVIGIGLAGIVVTHKVAGPIFKMKRQMGELGEGSFKVPYGLRKGDELVEFFEAYSDTVRKLRKREEDNLELLKAGIGSLPEGAEKDKFEQVQKEMERALQLDQKAART